MDSMIRISESEINNARKLLCSAHFLGFFTGETVIVSACFALFLDYSPTNYMSTLKPSFYSVLKFSQKTLDE